MSSSRCGGFSWLADVFIGQEMTGGQVVPASVPVCTLLLTHPATVLSPLQRSNIFVYDTIRYDTIVCI